MRSIVLLIISMVLPLIALSNEEYVCTTENQGKPIGKYTSYLIGLNGQNFEDVLNSNDFIKSEDVVPNYGLQKEAVWIKFDIGNPNGAKEVLVRVAYPILDEITFYYQDSDGQWDSVYYTEKTRLENRTYSEPSYGFNLTFSENETKTCYFKIKSSEQIIVPITVHSKQDYWDAATQDAAINAFYAGIVAIMIIYNLFVFYSVKDRSYIYYVLYLLFIGLTQLGIKGYISLDVLSLIPGFHDYSLVFFGSMGAMFGVIFTRDFLHTSSHLPKIDIVLKLTIPLFLLATVLSIAGIGSVGFILMQLGTSISAIVIFIASILSIRKGVASAKYFMIAWSTLLVSAIVFLLKDAGVLPYNVLTNYVMQAGSAIEMALLSFALANKINILQEETRISRERELDALKKNEKLIKEQNIVLEQKVEERTQDLQVANESLEGTLSTLKSAQSQLVSQEKMASLGQLTAGIAHEINNPINFVSSNVNPLRRDFDDLKDIITKYDELTNNDSEEDVRAVLDKLKDDVDYPYVLEEIDQLINGIQEGAERTAEIVKSLKNFSRLDEVESKFADIHEGIRSTIIILKSGSTKNVNIVTNFDEKIKHIECYPGKLNQVFSNVIVNAIQALTNETQPTESPEIVITTHELDDDGISISIKDNGPGIPDEVKDKVFEPFFTTKDVGEGTGLGLSIVFSIIESHKGSITVNSPTEGGTEFLITLPKTIH